MLKKTQNGRSMIEMLGVLAIIGVLSIGGLAGYNRAMTSNKVNNILDFVNRCYVEVRSHGNGDSFLADSLCGGSHNAGGWLNEVEPSGTNITCGRSAAGVTTCSVSNVTPADVASSLASKVGLDEIGNGLLYDGTTWTNSEVEIYI